MRRDLPRSQPKPIFATDYGHLHRRFGRFRLSQERFLGLQAADAYRTKSAAHALKGASAQNLARLGGLQEICSRVGVTEAANRIDKRDAPQCYAELELKANACAVALATEW